MLLAIAAPVLLWIAQNHIYLEDWSGSAWKMKILGWSNKPLEQIWCHPIFTPNGMAIFWSDLMKSFWRGELTWHRVTLSSSLPDLFYPLSSAVFAIIAAINALANKSSFSKDERFVTGMCVWACLASIIYMAIISTLFDFGHCRNPSQDHPYFTSGRLILGALIPFLVLYVNGLWIILRNIRWTAVRIAIVLLVMILVTYPEIFIRLKIIRHPYNWFHRVPGYTCFK
jgi:hypothetical protein